MEKIKVLVVDDSAFMRKMLSSMLSSDPAIDVVGTAMDGVFSLKKIKALDPDVITLDVDMPRMDGIEALKHIVRDYGKRVLIVSSLTERNAELTFKALEMGAFDFITKPKSSISLNIREIGSELTEKVKAAYNSPLLKLRARRITPITVPEPADQGAGRKPAQEVLAIGASTGGPNALSYLLPHIPKNFPAGIMIVQHMPEGFTGMFASRLNYISEIEVKEAQDGDLVLPGRALISPGDRHLKIKKMPLGAIAVLSNSQKVNGHKPSADILFQSVAEECGASAAGMIMTGMGTDGAEGIGEILSQGGLTIAQDEKSCVVFGMPKDAIEKKHIKYIMSLEGMADFLINHFAKKEEGYGTACC